MPKVWMITGANRGFGAELVRAAVAAGDQVVATSRTAAKVGDPALASPLVLQVPLDVTVESQVSDAVDLAVGRFGRIDVLVNNAGYALLGAVEECSADEVRAQFETNLFGLLNVTRAVLPVMRARRTGHVVNLSSIAAFDGSAGASSYAASKAAVEVISESLAKELAPLGIHVTIVEPGHFNTGFARDSGVFAARVIADYDTTAGALRRGFITLAQSSGGSDPVKLAAAIRALVASRAPPLRFLAGLDALARFEDTCARRNPDLEEWRSLSSALGAEPSVLAGV